jgi:Flp pilus assembly pilin Flp
MMYLRNLWQEEQGQDLIEYTLLMAFVAVASAVLFIGAGGSIKGIWTTTNSQLTQANTQVSWGFFRRELLFAEQGGDTIHNLFRGFGMGQVQRLFGPLSEWQMDRLPPHREGYTLNLDSTMLEQLWPAGGFAQRAQPA